MDVDGGGHDLMTLPDLKQILENRLRNYSALTVGDVIPIEFGGDTYWMEVVEALPEASVDITEVNVEIDFALTREEEARREDEYWNTWQPGQGLRFFRHD